MSQISITAFTVPEDSSTDTGPNTEPLPHPTTLNVRTCYLCDQPAPHIYHTTAFRWRGRDWPSELRHLCDLHMRNACALVVESVETRSEVEEAYERDERGKVA